MEEGGAVAFWNYFVDEITRAADQINDRCSVTGMTPLLLLIASPVAHEDAWEIALERAVLLFKKLGADFSVTDHRGRSALDWYLLSQFMFRGDVAEERRQACSCWLRRERL